MAISDRITSIEEHIKESYQELEGIGIDTTGVNNNLENIPKLIDGYWETLPKVTGEGTSITLDNTKEGKMKINLKGNTSQATTTGKNLLPNNAIAGTYSGITFTKNEDKSIKINGTATADTYINVWYDTTNNLINDTNQVYTMSIGLSNSNVGLAIFEYVNNSWVNKKYVYAESTTYTPSGNQTGQIFRVIVKNGATLNNVIVKPMLVKGTTVGDYEPYTNGASPNPDYPQDIHIVSGDNTINVVGKNLFKPTLQNNGTNIMLNNISSCSISNGEFSFTASGTDMYFGNVKNAGSEYSDERGIKIFRYDNDYISFNLSNTSLNRTYITAYDSNNISLGFTNINSNQGTYQFPSGCDYITIRFGKADAISGTTYKTTIMVAYGNTIPTYEPYIGNTYPVNLPIENLFNQGNYVTGIMNDRTLTNNNGKLTINGTSTLPSNFELGINITPTEDMTISINQLGGTFSGGEIQFLFIPTSGTAVESKIGTPAKLTNGVNYTTARISVRNNVVCTNLEVGLQLEKGSKANSFTPYGTTPIELCKIGNYQDVIKKSTGKNLFIPTLKVDDTNISTIRCSVSLSGDEYTFSATGSDCYFGNVVGTGNAYNKVLGTLYDVEGLTNIVFKPTNSSFDKNYACYYNNNKVSIGYAQINNSTGLITLPTGTKYVNFRIGINNSVSGTSYSSKFQLEIGNQATSFEPYGTGWYVKKEIGKFYSNSTTGWSYDNNHRYYRLIDNIVVPPNTDTVGQGFCNVRLVTANQTLQASTTPGLAIHPLSRLYISESVYNNISTTPTLLYYVYITPTYTEITDSTLISQLNALAKSYTSQTNISQESNDLASLLNATALEEM